MRKTTVILLAAAILVILGLIFYFLSEIATGGEEPLAAAPSTASSPAPAQSNPWKRSLSVSPGSDIGSIGGVIEKAFDEHQLRRRLILGFWAQGYQADQIAVMTGYRVKTVLDAMENYEKDVNEKVNEIKRLVYDEIDIVSDLPFPETQSPAQLKKEEAPVSPAASSEETN